MEVNRLVICGELREHVCYHLLIGVCFQVMFSQICVLRVYGSVPSHDIGFVVYSLC